MPFQNTRITPFNPLLERSSGVQRAITSLQAAAQNSSFGLNITYEEGEIIPPGLFGIREFFLLICIIIDIVISIFHSIVEDDITRTSR